MFGLGWIFGTVGLSYATGGAITPLPGIDKLLGKAGALSGKTTQLSGQVNAILSLIDKLIAKHKDDTSKLADLHRLQSQGRAFSERVGDAKTRLARYSDPQRCPELDHHANSGNRQAYDRHLAGLAGSIHRVSRDLDGLAHEIKGWASQVHGFDHIPTDHLADLDCVSAILPRHWPHRVDHLHMRG